MKDPAGGDLELSANRFLARYERFTAKQCRAVGALPVEFEQVAAGQVLAGDDHCNGLEMGTFCRPSKTIGPNKSADGRWQKIIIGS